MKKIEILPNGRKRVFTENTEPSKTDQSFQPMVDVNNIMSEYVKTGQIRHMRKSQGTYADVSEIPDLLTATIQVQKAAEAFSNLPSNLRSRFQNNPVNMVDFLNDPSNYEEAVTLGFFSKPTPQNLSTEEAPPITSQKRKPKPAANDDNSNDDE